MLKKPMAKKSPPFVSIWTALVLLTVWLLAGCVTPQPPLPPEPVRSVQAQPLPNWARQPTTPSECLPTCLGALKSERESWRKSLTSGTLPVEPASASTTLSGKH